MVVFGLCFMNKSNGKTENNQKLNVMLRQWGMIFMFHGGADLYKKENPIHFNALKKNAPGST